MKTTKLLITLVLLLSVFHVLAQSDVELSSSWEYEIEYGNYEKINKTIVSLDGTIVAVGEVKSENGGKSDGLFVIMDPDTGERISWKKFGDFGDDAFNSVVQNFDGTFTMVGSKEDGPRGRKRAWIMTVDFGLEVIYESQVDFAAGYSVANDIAINKRGEVLAVGMNYNDRVQEPWVLRIDGTPPFDPRTIGNGQLNTVNAITTGEDGNFVLAGSAYVDRRVGNTSAWIMKLNPDGREMWPEPQFFSGSGAQSAVDIAPSPMAGGYILTGFSEAGPNGKQDIWALKITEEGSVEWEQFFGGSNSDIGNAVIELSEGGYAIAGHTKSHMQEAGLAALTIVVTDAYGLEIAQHYQKIFKGKADNIAHCLLELNNGEEILLSGSCTPKKGQRLYQGFVGSFSYRLRPIGDDALTSQEVVSLDFVGFADASGDGYLDSGERGFLMVDVTNTSGEHLYEVSSRISPENYNNDLDYWEEVKLGTIPIDGIKRLVIPVRARSRNAQSTKLNIDVEIAGISVGNISVGMDVVRVAQTDIPDREPIRSREPERQSEPERFMEPAPVMEERAPPAQLVISDFNFTTTPNQQQGHTVKLVVELSNEGGSASARIPAAFTLPYGVKAQGSPNINVPGIRPGERQTVSFYFSYDESFKGDNIKVDFQTERQNDVASVRNIWSIPVERRIIRTIPDEIYWVSPDPDAQQSRTIDVNDREIDLKVISLSSRDQSKRNFAARVNGRRMQGQKMDESTLGPPVLTSDNVRKKRTYNTKVKLREGINKVEVVYFDEDGTTEVSKSRTITFNYIPRGKPNLYVLSIGVQHDDLKYTVKDAKDFASTYWSLRDGNTKGFKKVEVFQMVKEDETKQFNLQKAFLDLRKMNVKDGDLVVIFISTHGQVMENGEYILMPSDYDPRYPELTSINFNKDVLKQLRMLDGNKLVFVDACHSGIAGSRAYSDKAASKVMNDLIRATSGMEIFASCSDQEFSYEDDAWNNGAFTKAILEAFNNEKVEIEGRLVSADIYKDNPISDEPENGSDGVITIGELRKYLQMRVPYMVKKVKGKHQNPTTKTTEHLEENTGIFMVNY